MFFFRKKLCTLRYFEMLYFLLSFKCCEASLCLCGNNFFLFKVVLFLVNCQTQVLYGFGFGYIGLVTSYYVLCRLKGTKIVIAQNFYDNFLDDFFDQIVYPCTIGVVGARQPKLNAYITLVFCNCICLKLNINRDKLVIFIIVVVL